MKKELLHKFYGTPIYEWISKVPNELPQDAVGMWQLVTSGEEGFGLEEEDLDEYISLCIAGILNAGAKPVYGQKKETYSIWVLNKKYIGSNDEIVKLILQDLKNAKIESEELYKNFIFGLWFALPEFVEK